jgi:hypothetical protein
VTRTLGAGITTDIAAVVGERCQLIKLDFANLSNVATPVYLTTAAQPISWNGFSWEPAGLEIDAMGESADGSANGLRIKLSGVHRDVLSLIHGARYRGRMATVWHAALSQASGAVLADPVVLYTGPMNGGFQIGEARGEFGGGRVDINTRLTSRIDELVKVRGIRTNEASHRTTVPGATTDTFFQNVATLMGRPAFWGVKAPATRVPQDSAPSGPITQTQPGGGAPSGGVPWPGVAPQGPASPMSPWPGVSPPPAPPTPSMDPGRPG